MKKILIIIFCLPVILFGQSVPQGVNYQAVATNSLGIELINQTISIRASVLSNSANGTIEWEEIHTTTTDTFGLFNLIIGQGTSTGNGSTSNFSDINWGANTHFLKIEMDINGGSTYSHMGTNQMMSVPYALYAENTKIDSITIANMIAASSNSSINYNFPDGLGGDAITTVFTQTSSCCPYTVPTGKRLYILSTTSSSVRVNGNVVGRPINGTFIICNSGDIVEPFGNGNYHFNGILIDNVSDVDAISTVFTQTSSCCPYTVPSAKKLYILSTTSSSVRVNGNFVGRPIDGTFIFCNSGDIVEPSNNGNYHFNGYLVDDDYFSSSSGGSSSSTIDSSYIESLVQLYTSGVGGGCDYKFPIGRNGLAVNHNLMSGDYIVPAGKQFLITHALKAGGGNRITINGFQAIIPYQNEDYQYMNPAITNSGDIISKTGNSTYINISGVLIDEVNEVNPIIIDLVPGDYIVPAGKQLVITHALVNGSSNPRIKINGFESIIAYNHEENQNMPPIITNSGDVISINGSLPNNLNIVGYLVDENYFIDCGH